MRRVAAALAATFLLLPGFSSHIPAVRAFQPRPAAPPAPGPQRREPAVPFHVGETLTYDVSWSSLLVAGTASLTVTDKKPADGSSAYAIVADGRPLPAMSRLFALHYRLEGLIDSFSLLSQRSVLLSEEGDRHATATTRFDRKARKAFFERTGDDGEKKTIPITAQTQDGLGMLYALRAIPLAAGGRIELPIANDGELFTVSVNAIGVEQVRVPLRTFDAMNLKLTILDDKRQPFGKDIAVWISTDGQHMPVKLLANLPVGNFVLALKDAR